MTHRHDVPGRLRDALDGEAFAVPVEAIADQAERPCRPCQDEDHERCLHPVALPVEGLERWSSCCCEQAEYYPAEEGL